MKPSVIIGFAVALYSLSLVYAEDSTDQPKPKPTTTVKPTFTDLPTSTVQPKPKPTTTVQPTSTDLPTSTSTVQPKPKPTTTVKPTSTVQPKPTSTVQPTPTPSPEETLYTYYVRDNKTGVVCLLVKLHATFRVPYNTTNNKTRTVKVSLGKNNETNVTGNCMIGWKKGAGQQIRLLWRPTNSSSAWNFSIFVNKSADNSSFQVSQMLLVYNVTKEMFPNGTQTNGTHVVRVEQNYVNNTVRYFPTALGRYYECNSIEDLNFKEKVVLTMSQVVINAFRNYTNTTIQGERHQCAHDALLRNLVPIIVGVGLAILIIIVLAAYLFSRHRTHAGYQSI